MSGTVEITWSDLALLVARQWIWALATLVLSLLVVGFLVHSITPTFEATVVLRVGQSLEPSRDGGDKALIEPVGDVIERLNSAAFQTAVLSKIQIAADSESGSRLRRGLKIEQLSPPDGALKMTVRGRDRSELQVFAQAALDYLVEVHKQLQAPAIRALEALDANLRDDLRKAQEQRQALSDQIPGDNIAGAWNAVSRFQKTLMDRDAEIRNLGQRRLLVEERARVLMRLTRSVGGVSVPERPIAANRIVYASVGMSLSFALAMLAAVVVDFLKRRRSIQDFVKSKQ